MTISIFVLDVEEFLPLVKQAETRDDIRVTGPGEHGYYQLEAEGMIEFNRKLLQFKPAVWHGLLTGGFVGRIDSFDNDNLVLVEEAK